MLLAVLSLLSSASAIETACSAFARNFEERPLTLQATYIFPHTSFAESNDCPNARFDIEFSKEALAEGAGPSIDRFLTSYVTRGVQGSIEFDAVASFERHVQGKFLGKLVVKRVARIRRTQID
jgi:hypothetical protein